MSFRPFIREKAIFSKIKFFLIKNLCNENSTCGKALQWLLLHISSLLDRKYLKLRYLKNGSLKQFCFKVEFCLREIPVLATYIYIEEYVQNKTMNRLCAKMHGKVLLKEFSKSIFPD
jgi:hypothetical protein